LRENRRIKAALRMARLPILKTLAGFDFSFQPSLDRNRIMALAGLDFITFVMIDAVLPANANGVLYKLGANSGGLTCFVEDGILCYEYNLFIIQRTKIRASEKLPAGRVRIEIETNYVVPRPGGPLKVTMKGDGKILAEGTVPISAALVFTGNDCLDIGMQQLAGPWPQEPAIGRVAGSRHGSIHLRPIVLGDGDGRLMPLKRPCRRHRGTAQEGGYASFAGIGPDGSDAPTRPSCGGDDSGAV
jgi:hypothetical protein